MNEERPFTGWALEHQIKRWLEEVPPSTPYCVLCLAEAFGIPSAKGYSDIFHALRRVGTYQPDTYDTFQGKCPRHTGQRGRGTFWMIRRR